MKAILYIGSTLMVGASIYGFIDYKKSSHDQSFINLYENKEQAIKPGERKVPDPAKGTLMKSEPTEEIKINEEPKEKKKKIRTKEFSRAALDEKYVNEERKTITKKESTKKEQK